VPAKPRKKTGLVITGPVAASHDAKASPFPTPAVSQYRLDLFSLYQETSKLSNSKWNSLPILETLLKRRKVCECRMKATMVTWSEIGLIEQDSIWPLKIRGVTHTKQP